MASRPPHPLLASVTYDTLLAVPGGLEPRMESILQRDIPQLRRQDEAENWGKIRIIGNSLPPFEGVTVSIGRKEPPGHFNLRIIIRGADRSAADAFQKALTQRIELALYAAARGALSATTGLTQSDSPFHPPFFSREALLFVPETRESGMALRIKDAIPQLHWLDQAADWEQVRIIGSSDDLQTVVSILRGDAIGPFRLWAHAAASGAPSAYDAHSQEVLSSLFDRIYAATEAYPPSHPKA